MTLEEILLLQTSFESDWRFDGFDGIEFDNSEHECFHEEDEEKLYSDEEQFCQTSIEEKAECDQHVENFGSETESRLSEQNALCSNRKSPKRQFSNPKSETDNSFSLKPSLIPGDEVQPASPLEEYHKLPSQIINEETHFDSHSHSRVPPTPKEHNPRADETRAEENSGSTRRTTQLSFVRDSITGIDLDDQNFSVAKFRWIQAVNKIRVKIRESDNEGSGANDIPKIRKSGWGVQAIASNFLSSIDSMPNFKLRPGL